MAHIQLSESDLYLLRVEINKLFSRATFEVFFSDFGRRLENYTSNGSWELQTVELVQRISVEPRFDEFVLAVAAARIQSASLQNLAQRVRTQIAAEQRKLAVDPYKVVWLDRSRPLINRGYLRDYAQQLWGCNSGRILAVRGAKQTGRSHSLFFMQYLASRIGFRAIDINLLHISRSGAECNAFQLARVLNERLSLQFPFSSQDEQQQDAYKYEPFINKLLSMLEMPGAPKYTLIFDGFGHFEPAESGVRLVQRIAALAIESLQNLWVVLLGFDADLVLPTYDEPMVEQTVEFTDDHLVDFFGCFYADVLGRQPMDKEIEDHVVEALETAKLGEPNVLLVSRKTAEICRRLLQQ